MASKAGPDDEVCHIPWNLKQYAPTRLDKLSKEALFLLLRQRGLACPRTGDVTARAIDALLEWKDEHADEDGPSDTTALMTAAGGGGSQHRRRPSSGQADTSSASKTQTPAKSSVQAGRSPDAPTERVAGLPASLHGWAESRLSDLEPVELIYLLQSRGLEPPGSSGDRLTRECVKLLLQWKKDQSGGGQGEGGGGASYSEAKAVCEAKDVSEAKVGKSTADTRRPSSASGEAPLIVMTHNIKDFTNNPETVSGKLLDTRISNLVSCYAMHPEDLPDLLVIQETQAGNEPTNRLAEALSKATRPRRPFAFHNSELIGDNESAAFIFDDQKLELLACEAGLLISPSSSLIKRNFAKPLSAAFTRQCGFSADDLEKHTYPGAPDERLFIRWPVYALFRHRDTGLRLLVCSLHLKSDPTQELLYTGQVFPRDPVGLYRQQRILFICLGDMNLTACRTEERQLRPIAASNGAYGYALAAPLRHHCTNLSSYLSGTAAQQCFDNAVLPRWLLDRSGGVTTHILELPGGFAKQLVDAIKQQEAEDAAQGAALGTRSRKANPSYHAFLMFSDHRPVRLHIKLPSSDAV